MKPSKGPSATIVSAPITRPFAERINAVEGLALSAELSTLLDRLEQDEVPMDERRRQVLDTFRMKRR